MAVYAWLSLRSRRIDPMMVLLHQPSAMSEHVLDVTIRKVHVLFHGGYDLVIYESFYYLLDLLDLLPGRECPLDFDVQV